MMVAMTIVERYRAMHPKATALAERARRAIPGGVTHDIRHLVPHAIYVDLRARGYGGAYAASELGSTELELGDLESESGHGEEACRWYRQSAALFDDLAARDALRSDSHEEAGKARRAAAACGR